MLLEPERERLWPFRMARESAAEVLFLGVFATLTVRGGGDGRRGKIVVWLDRRSLSSAASV